MRVMKPQNLCAHVGTKRVLYFHISRYSKSGESGLLTNQMPHSFVMQLLPCNYFLFLGVMKLATQKHHATEPCSCCCCCCCCTVMQLVIKIIASDYYLRDSCLIFYAHKTIYSIPG